MTEAIRNALSRTNEVKIAVFGDYTLDKYLMIDPERDEPSVETGLTAYQVHEKRLYAGCGGTITNNLRSLGAEVFCIGLCGDDGEGYELRRCLREIGADTEGMVVSSQLCTSTYTKPMRKQADGAYVEMNRLDFRNFSAPSQLVQDQLLRNLEHCLSNVNAVILIDQFVQRNSGVITDYVREQLCKLAADHPDIIFYVDSRAFSGEFRNMILKCNNFELMAMGDGTGDPEDEAVLLQQADRLQDKTGCNFYVTRGSRGIMILQNHTACSVPAVSVTGPIDICGAGDASSAGIVLGLSLGLSPKESAMLACCVSSITIQQIGVTGCATVPQVIRRLEQYQNGETI